MDLTLTYQDDANAVLDPTVPRAALHRAMFLSVATTVRSHLLTLDAQRHRSTVPGPGFYARAAETIAEVDLDTDSFTVSISQPGFAQRYFGGTITAGTGSSSAKLLTIPATPQALGRRAGDFTNLKCIFFRDQNLGALIQPLNQGGIPDEQGRPPVIFWLKRSVTQAPDPDVLPDPATLQDAAYAAANTFLQSTWQTGDPSPPSAAENP